MEMTALRARVSRTIEQRTAASQKRDCVTDRRVGEAESTRAPPESHEAWSKSQKLIMHSDRTTGSTASMLGVLVLKPAVKNKRSDKNDMPTTTTTTTARTTTTNWK